MSEKRTLEEQVREKIAEMENREGCLIPIACSWGASSGRNAAILRGVKTSRTYVIKNRTLYLRRVYAAGRCI